MLDATSPSSLSLVMKTNSVRETEDKTDTVQQELYYRRKRRSKSEINEGTERKESKHGAGREEERKKDHEGEKG